MTVLELLQKLKALSKEHGEFFDYIPSRGKGSHGRVYFGKRFATVPGIKKELSIGTLRAILKQLNIDNEEFNR